MTDLTPEEQEAAWVAEAREVQARAERRAREKAELAELRSQAEAGTELGRRVASGETDRLGLDPADVPEPADPDLRRQVEAGRELARRRNARCSSQPAGGDES